MKLTAHLFMVIRNDKNLVQPLTANNNTNNTHKLFNKSDIICSLTTWVISLQIFALARLITTQPNSPVSRMTLGSLCNGATVSGHSARLYPTPCDRLLQVTDSQNNRSEYSREHPNFIRPGKERETDSPDPSVWVVCNHTTISKTPGQSFPSGPPSASLTEQEFPVWSPWHTMSLLWRQHCCGQPAQCVRRAPRGLRSWTPCRQLGGRGHPRALADNHGWLQTKH